MESVCQTVVPTLHVPVECYRKDDWELSACAHSATQENAAQGAMAQGYVSRDTAQHGKKTKHGTLAVTVAFQRRRRDFSSAQSSATAIELSNEKIMNSHQAIAR